MPASVGSLITHRAARRVVTAGVRSLGDNEPDTHAS
jgi:hypothetical protein